LSSPVIGHLKAEHRMDPNYLRYTMAMPTMRCQPRLATASPGWGRSRAPSCASGCWRSPARPLLARHPCVHARRLTHFTSQTTEFRLTDLW